MHDPDAPTGGAGWWHWVVANIPADVNKLEGGAGTADGARLPKGAIQVTTDFGMGLGRPVSAGGRQTASLQFHPLHALKVEKLDLPANANASLAGFMINANSIGKTTLTGLYGRK